MEKRTDFYDFIDKIQWQDKYIEYIEQENRRLSEKNKIYSNALVQEKEEKKKLNERIKELEQCNLNLQTWLDNKEKVNNQLRKDIKWYEKEEDRLREENKKLKECNKSQSEVINNVFIPQKERLEEENKTLKDNVEFLHSCLDDRDKSIELMKHKNELQEKALIRLCLKHHYDSIIIEGEEVIEMSNYKVVEKKKPKEEKLF